MEKYIAEVGKDKQFILLINKADFMSEELIAHWNQFFKERNVPHIFFSALAEQSKLDKLDEISESEGEQESSDDENDDENQNTEEQKQQ